MGRNKEPVVLLDTHIIIWLYAALREKLTKTAEIAIETHQLRMSPFSRLEIQYLFEINKITAKPDAIYKSLAKSLGLEIFDTRLDLIIDHAINIQWTRDTFDRLIVAEAMCADCGLITADRAIRRHFKGAVW